MPRGAKSKYTQKQKRQAEHIEQGYCERGVSKEEAESRAWASVNAIDHGGKKHGGSGRGKATNKEPAKKGGRKGGQAAVTRPKAARVAPAKKPFSLERNVLRVRRRNANSFYHWNTRNC